MTRAPDLDALLAHADWLGALSRQLCRDRHAADDAAQEALLASLRSPPRDGGNVRAFLATLLRNVLRIGHRKDARRVRREQRLAPRDFAEAADLAAARAEVHQVLGQLVLELPEPQRALVLLCYFEGHDVGGVAARSGMTRDAVHAHLRRARETLRSRLQRDDAHRWSAPALLLLERTLWLAPGVLAMTMKGKVAAAAALLVAALCWWALPAREPAPTPGVVASRSSIASPATADVPAPAADTVARVDATHGVVVPSAPPVESPAPDGRLTGCVVDQAGMPVVPARVYALALRDGKPSDDHVLQDDVDERGRFEMVSTFDGDVLVVGIPLRTIPGSTLTDLHERLVAATASATVGRRQQAQLADLVCAPAVAITGVVREPGARGVPGVRVGWYPTEEKYGVLLDDFVLTWLPNGSVHVDVTQRAGGSAFSRGIATDADGRFAIATAAGTTGWMFLMGPHAEGIERLVPERRITAPAAVDFDLLAPACVRVLAEGKPVANRPVSFELDVIRKDGPWRENYRTDENGEIRIQREHLAPIRGRALRPGREPLDFAVPDDATPASPLAIDLGVARTTPVQVVITSERPLRVLGGSLWRLDVPPAPIGMTQDPGSSVITLRADVPAGPYRLVVYAARGAEGDDTFVLRATHDVTVGDEPVSVPVRVQHGGRIRVNVATKDAQHAPGTIRIVDAAGVESKPSMHAPGRGNGEGGALWAPGPLTTSQVQPAGRYEVIVDHGARGTHRQFVDVRACQVSDVTITLP